MKWIPESQGCSRDTGIMAPELWLSTFLHDSGNQALWESGRGEYWRKTVLPTEKKGRTPEPKPEVHPTFYIQTQTADEHNYRVHSTLSSVMKEWTRMRIQKTLTFCVAYEAECAVLTVIYIFQIIVINTFMIRKIL